MKSYTNLEQSKELAKILPLDSADMVYIASATDDDGETLYTAEYKSEIIIHESDDYINCWSLAALIELLPPIDNLKPMIDLEGNSIYYSGNNTPCTNGDTLIDTCVDMIIKLKESNLLRLK